MHELQPDCLVNGRIGNDLGDYGEARDNAIPGDVVDADWETPATINDTWGFKHHDHNWKSTQTLVRKLVDIVSKGGNYLLNVGPTAEGVIPGPSVERLRAMGSWLRINGESLYGTRPGPIQGVNWYRSTVKPGKLYLHVFDYPKDGELWIPLGAGSIVAARLLASGESLPVRLEGDTHVIAAPKSIPDEIDTVVECQLAV